MVEFWCGGYWDCGCVIFMYVLFKFLIEIWLFIEKNKREKNFVFLLYNVVKLVNYVNYFKLILEIIMRVFVIVFRIFKCRFIYRVLVSWFF